MTSSDWQHEKPKHGIVVMKGTLLLCSCGIEIRLAGRDLNLHQRLQYDALLDRHQAHVKRQEKPG